MFVPCEKLFPEWPEARETLTRIVDGTEWWLVNGTLYYKVSLGLPRELFTLLPHIRKRVGGIISQLMEERVPCLDGYLGQQSSYSVKHNILNDIKRLEEELIAHGYRPILDEMAHRLGVR